MDAQFDNLLTNSIVTKCKVALAVAFQEDTKQPMTLSKYELAYIIDKLKKE